MSWLKEQFELFPKPETVALVLEADWTKAFAYLLLNVPLPHLHAGLRTVHTDCSCSLRRFASHPTSSFSVVSSAWCCDACHQPHVRLLPYIYLRWLQWIHRTDTVTDLTTLEEHPNAVTHRTYCCNAETRYITTTGAAASRHGHWLQKEVNIVLLFCVIADQPFRIRTTFH